MAEYEARKTGKRIRFNNAMRIKNKQVVAGQQCFLFPWKVAGEKRNRHLERNMEKAEMLYDILNYFEVHQSKRATLGYTNKKYGTEINMKTMTSLLTDTLLYGEYKGVADYVEPYISKERFDNIQAILKRNARHSERANHVFLFSGILKCHCCGRNMVGNYHNRGLIAPNFSYRCNRYRLDKVCTNSQSITEHKIESQLLDNLQFYIANEIIKVESIEEKPSVEVDNTKKIEALKKEMARLTNTYIKGRMEEEDYDKEYDVLKVQLKELEEIEQPEERNLDALKELLQTDYRTIYNALDKEHKKAFWRNLIKEFTLDENKRVVASSIIFF